MLALVTTRLVWLELILARSALLGAVALGEWPDDFPSSDDAWTAQRNRLTVGWENEGLPRSAGGLPVAPGEAIARQRHITDS